jgi:hypothetical protein
MKTMNSGWRLESKLCSKLQIITPTNNKTMWPTKITKFAKIEKGLWN